MKTDYKVRVTREHPRFTGITPRLDEVSLKDAQLALVAKGAVAQGEYENAVLTASGGRTVLLRQDGTLYTFERKVENRSLPMSRSRMSEGAE